MKYVLYFGFWIAVFYAVIRFGMSVISEQDKAGNKSPEEGVGIDPVCGMTVDKGTALTSQFEGKSYWFCAEACKNAFEKEPHRYAIK